MISLREELEQERELLANYKAIAAEREQSLCETQEAFEKCKGTMETLLKEAQVETKAKQERIVQLEKELSETILKMGEQQQEVERQLQNVQGEYDKLSEELRSVQAKASLAEEKAKAYEEATRRANLEAEEARCNYNRELILHSADVEAMARLKEDLQVLVREKQQAVEEKDAAQLDLHAKELSWKVSEEKLSQQMAEAEERYSELKKQNDILHEQLQEVAARSIKQYLPEEGEKGDEGPTQPPKSMEQLTEVVAYLRREVNIHATRQEAAQQEAWRYKQQAEQALRSLDECRAKLAAAQEAIHDKEHSQSQHRALLDQLSQLNLLRESNVTLREEAERYQREAREAEQKMEKIKEQIDPLLKEKLELAAQVEVLAGQKDAALADAARWRGRVDQLLDRYERVDPEAHRMLLQEHATLQADLEATRAKLLAADEKAAELFNHGRHWKAQSTKLSVQLKAAQQELEEERKKKEERDKERVQELEREIEALRAKVSVMLPEKEGLEKEAEELRQKVAKLQDGLKLAKKALAQKINEIAKMKASIPVPPLASPSVTPTQITPPGPTAIGSPSVSTPSLPPLSPQSIETPLPEQPPVKKPRIAPPETQNPPATTEPTPSEGSQQTLPTSMEVAPQDEEQKNEQIPEPSFEAARMRPLSAVPKRQATTVPPTVRTGKRKGEAVVQKTTKRSLRQTPATSTTPEEEKLPSENEQGQGV